MEPVSLGHDRSLLVYTHIFATIAFAPIKRFSWLRARLIALEDFYMTKKSLCDLGNWSLWPNQSGNFSVITAPKIPLTQGNWLTFCDSFLFDYSYWDFEAKGSQSFSTDFKSDISSHSDANVFATGKTDANVVIFGFHDSKTVFQLKEWYE